jgi:hypothetical protein
MSDSNSTNGQAINGPIASPPVADASAVANTPDRPLNPGLYAPNPAAPALRELTLFEIVAELMNPPQDMRYPPGKVTLNITWAVGKAGKERFERTALNHRHSLKQDDDLYVLGVSAGLSNEVCQWLRYGEDEFVLDVSHFQ